MYIHFQKFAIYILYIFIDHKFIQIYTRRIHEYRRSIEKICNIIYIFYTSSIEVYILERRNERYNNVPPALREPHVVIEHGRFGFDCSVLASERQCSFVAFRRYAGRIWIGGPSFTIGLRYPGPWRFCSRIRGSHTGFRSTATPVLPQQPWYSERGCQSGREFR